LPRRDPAELPRRPPAVWATSEKWRRREIESAQDSTATRTAAGLTKLSPNLPRRLNAKVVPHRSLTGPLAIPGDRDGVADSVCVAGANLYGDLVRCVQSCCCPDDDLIVSSSVKTQIQLRSAPRSDEKISEQRVDNRSDRADGHRDRGPRIDGGAENGVGMISRNSTMSMRAVSHGHSPPMPALPASAGRRRSDRSRHVPRSGADFGRVRLD
jgi:hypothetical protein